MMKVPQVVAYACCTFIIVEGLKPETISTSYKLEK